MAHGFVLSYDSRFTVTQGFLPFLLPFSGFLDVLLRTRKPIVRIKPIVVQKLADEICEIPPVLRMFAENTAESRASSRMQGRTRGGYLGTLSKLKIGRFSI